MAPPSSTVAMSAYNVLASGEAATTERLRFRIPGAPTLAELDAALQEMRRRGWVTYGPSGWDVIDAKRRLVRMRDLSDAEVINGEVRGGWNGWTVQCRQRGFLLIEDAIAEGAAASGATA